MRRSVRRTCAEPADPRSGRPGNASPILANSAITDRGATHGQHRA
jgi:hypothetical protein